MDLLKENAGDGISMDEFFSLLGRLLASWAHRRLSEDSTLSEVIRLRLHTPAKATCDLIELLLVLFIRRGNL